MGPYRSLPYSSTEEHGKNDRFQIGTLETGKTLPFCAYVNR